MEHYNTPMKKQQKIFNQDYNKTIIQMIRKKFSPLHRSKKHALVANMKKVTLSQHNGPHDHSLPTLPSAQIYNLESSQDRNEMRLIDRVKDYIQVKRRENHLLQKKSELEQYISIFEMPIAHHQRQKRQSIQLSVFQFEKKEERNSKKMNLGQENTDMTDQARSILNAKIRRKLNHKKIIELVRRN